MGEHTFCDYSPDFADRIGVLMKPSDVLDEPVCVPSEAMLPHNLSSPRAEPMFQGYQAVGTDCSTNKLPLPRFLATYVFLHVLIERFLACNTMLAFIFEHFIIMLCLTLQVKICMVFPAPSHRTYIIQRSLPLGQATSNKKSS